MLNLFHAIYFRAGIWLFLLFLLAYGACYFILRDVIDEMRVWVELGVVWLLVFLLSVFILHTLHKKLNADVKTLVSYLKKIDAKEYETPVHIQHYTDFLELSLLLKNLVKRLHKRKKRKK